MNKKNNKEAVILSLISAGIFYLKLIYLDNSVGAYIGDSIYMIFMLTLCWSSTSKD
ncbi:hypothetical protein [Ligilactobacillus salivarius]|uniref:hypothetical protein n=1 Tax=Ligilactobacillus salivarius TaxID=1624 RepID=UPI00365D5F50